MVLTTVPKHSLALVIKIQEQSHISQILKSLRVEFESVRVALIIREVSPELDTCFQVLLEEIQL